MWSERGMNIETVRRDDNLPSQPNATPRHFNPVAYHAPLFEMPGPPLKKKSN